ncbi:DUF397 domain-containing protein [Saccharopolyspora karakumensis]|uniref:DUF397 domain-containing protein n=1 Tax=Saccharopolyspora karakumensis TaxID=2530386 RepID=A0A4R5C0K1_9PSEU|nr:DUF397 domain-containing protein [Saccharopolyspora karakumensis]TDD93081.1 DUF397 domain-containing protein [Saccharopolyspora karakumensis]
MALREPMSWRKSSRSHQETACVEVGSVGSGAAVRDSKNLDAGYFTTTSRQWRLFIEALKADRFER